jgi:hypothetical protein
MAEERTLGLARTQPQTAEEPSKEELQRRMDEATRFNFTYGDRDKRNGGKSSASS